MESIQRPWVFPRRATRSVTVGNVVIGGGHPISVQSMTNTDTHDVESTTFQIRRLIEAGCDIVRISLPDLESARLVKVYKERFNIPIVGDVHFDHRVAVEAIKAGVDKVRINPGNVGAEWKVAEVVAAAKERGVPIRVGANTGSLPRDLGHLPRHEALAEAALREVRLLEKLGFEDIVVSVKSSNVLETILANRHVASHVEYPLHVGVTEAGTLRNSLLKSALAFGVLLLEGLVDTMRVSIAGDPVEEVLAGRKILTFLGIEGGVDVVACPTCARAVFDVQELATTVENALKGVRKNVRVSVLGCIVNGIGEGKDSDIGIAGTRDGVVLFAGGRIVGTYDPQGGIEKMMELIAELRGCGDEDPLS